MRPYLALIKDSFRAAIASRILYILFFVIALLLLALAPLHMKEALDWKLIFMENVKRPDALARKLIEKRNDGDNKGANRIWEMLPDDVQEKLNKFIDSDSTETGAEEQADADSDGSDDEAPEAESGEVDAATDGNKKTGDEALFYQMALLPALNEVIEDRDFYREEDWDVSLSKEARELIEAGPENLTDERSRRLNRLLFARVLSPEVETGDTALEFYYGIWKWDFLTTSLTHQQFAQLITTQLPYYFDKFVLSIGLFIAILVTAGMIPETFEPGSLNLLLSKPVMRWALYIAKFLGGCAFIMLCASFLFLGLWLWLGLGLGVWDRAILISIPLYVLVFAIYFSVSALIGIVWRSPIVAVVITLLFWALCFAVGSVHGIFANKMANSSFINLLPIQDEAYSVDILHQIKKWDSKKKEWEIEMPAELGDEAKIQFGVNSWMIPLRNVPAIPGIDQRIAPIYDQESGLIIGAPFVAEFTTKRKMLAGRAGGKEFVTVGEFPRDTQELAVSKRGLIAVTADGRFHLVDRNSLNTLGKELQSETARSSEEEKQTDEDAAVEEDESSNQSQLSFKKIGPRRRVSVRSSNLVDFNPETEQFAIFRRGKLTIFGFESDDSEKITKADVLSPDVEFDKKMSCLVVFKGKTVLLAFGNGLVLEYDAASLEKLTEYHPVTRSAIETIAGSDDGNYIVTLYRNGNLWLLDKKNSEQFKFMDVAGQGAVSAFAFDNDNGLWVAENSDRVTRHDLVAETQGDRITPSGTWYENTFRFGLSPLYKIFPKPGEFYKVVSHLSSAGDTTTNLNVDLRQNPLENANPWQPLWSGLGFMSVMLFIAGAYFHFKDF